MPSLADLVLLLYYGALGVLALYGAHRITLLMLLRRHHRPSGPVRPTPGSARYEARPLPRITVQLPLYNERFVAKRLLKAVAAIDYPKDRLQIQVLDDSTDDTTDVLAHEVAALKRRGLRVELVHRAQRDGFKAGALEAGLATADGELIAIFDADFVPPIDFLQRCIGPFEDPRVGMVQARWDYLNRDHSLLTRLQALLLDGHFVIEHAARASSSRFFNFNGTAGVWRREAIVDAGGWQHDTLTEDLDISYRAQLVGWRFAYLSDLVVPSELPIDVAAFKTQQYRWARGSIQTARKLLSSILRSAEPWWRKLEACVHLTNNWSYVLNVLVSVLLFPAMLARRGEPWLLLAIDLPLFAIATGSVTAYYVAGQRNTPTGEPHPLRLLAPALALGIGLSLNNTGAVFTGAVRRGGIFVRTPKYREVASSSALPAAYLARVGPGFLIEGAFAIYSLACLAAATSLEMWVSLPFLYLFFQGYAYIFTLSAITLWRRRRPLRSELSEAETPA